jgi:hypothetical protein
MLVRYRGINPELLRNTSAVGVGVGVRLVRLCKNIPFTFKREAYHWHIVNELLPTQAFLSPIDPSNHPHLSVIFPWQMHGQPLTTKTLYALTLP